MKKENYRKYTKQEKEEIKKTLAIIVQEFKDACKSYDCLEVEFPCPLLEIGGYPCSSRWHLMITPKRMILYYYTCYYESAPGPFFLDKKSSVYYDDEACQAYQEFISHYKNIREKLMEYLDEKAENKKELVEEKKNFMEEMKKIQEDHSADVEIDCPDSIGLTKIEVTKEDDKKIGTINFGSQTIRIITRGNIVLVNEEEHSKKKELKK